MVTKLPKCRHMTGLECEDSNPHCDFPNQIDGLLMHCLSLRVLNIHITSDYCQVSSRVVKFTHAQEINCYRYLFSDVYYILKLRFELYLFKIMKLPLEAIQQERCSHERIPGEFI